MSVAAPRPTTARLVAERQVFFTFWIAGLAFCFGLISLFLLQRLGLPLPLVIGTLIVLASGAVLIMGLQGRTMSSQPFFYAGKDISSSQIGLAGSTDWLGGTVLLLLVGLSTKASSMLAAAVMLAVLLQAVLFAGPVQRSNTLTIPGFLGWRFNSKTLSFLALLIVCVILAGVLVAEFQILRTIASNLFGTNSETLVLALVVAAAFPSLVGGWLSLVIVNGALVIFLLICLLTSATAMAFLPETLRELLALDPNFLSLPPIPIFQTDPFGFITALSANTFGPVIALIVLATGLSVMPQSLSRLALNRSSIAASESNGWTALFLFLLLSALPLSLALVLPSPVSEPLSKLMQQHVVLYALPHFAVLFAAFNAVAATLFLIAISVVRALRRGQSLDPGERSIFPTRLLIILISIALIMLPYERVPDSASLLFIAISMTAGSFFAPVAAAVWFSRIPFWIVMLTVLGGAGITVGGILGHLPLPAFLAPAAAILASSIILALTYVTARMLGKSPADPALTVLRQLDRK